MLCYILTLLPNLARKKTMDIFNKRNRVKIIQDKEREWVRMSPNSSFVRVIWFLDPKYAKVHVHTIFNECIFHWILSFFVWLFGVCGGIIIILYIHCIQGKFTMILFFTCSPDSFPFALHFSNALHFLSFFLLYTYSFSINLFSFLPIDLLFIWTIIINIHQSFNAHISILSDPCRFCLAFIIPVKWCRFRLFLKKRKDNRTFIIHHASAH